MIGKLGIAWALMAVCVTVHATGLIMARSWLKHHEVPGLARFWPAVGLLIRIAGWCILLHLAQIGLWALVYLVGEAMPDGTSAFYFSAVTYTTTGYGDLLLPEDWRAVGGVEALTGILMCGLSTGLFFTAFSGLAALAERGRRDE